MTDALLAHAIMTMDCGESEKAMTLLSESDRRLVKCARDLIELSVEAARLGRERGGKTR